MEPAIRSAYILLSSPLMHDLGDEIQSHLASLGMTIPHHRVDFTTFANGEVIPRIPETIRGQHVFFLHALQYPDPNTALMMLLIANDAMKRASAASITDILPYLAYMRQDRMDQPRAPISARMVADLIETNKKVVHIITMDLHAEQEQGFFSIPVDNLSGAKIFAHHVREVLSQDLHRLAVVSPDAGGAVRNKRIAKALGGIPVGVFEKTRSGPNRSHIGSTHGVHVKGKAVIAFEDIIDTGGTAVKFAKKILTMGAHDVLLCATHGIFSGPALKRFARAGVRVAVTDSIPRTPAFYAQHPWITKVSIAKHLAEAIYEAAQVGGSISKLA